MQNEVFNRKLFQRKDGARTRLNQLARADQPSGILASSQPLIDEAMKSVRQPETSAIPMDASAPNKTQQQLLYTLRLTENC